MDEEEEVDLWGEEGEDAVGEAGERREVEAGADAAGERLDRYLASRFPDLSRSRLQMLMKQGRVEVNGGAASAKQAVRPGSRIMVHVPPPQSLEAEPEAIPLRILHEDESIVVVNKEEGMCVHPGPGNPRGTLVNALLHHCRGELSGIGGVERPGIVHRLDKDTSGCVVVAKTDAAHRVLSRSFADRETSKVYLCVVRGRVVPDEGRIENFLGRNPQNRKKIGIVGEEAGRWAITEFEVLSRSGSGHSVVRCRILTGRTHQIRVHMASALGHAILGDPIYGKGSVRGGIPATRLLLHAWRLGLRHPVSGAWMEWTAPLPEAFGPFLEEGQRRTWS